MMRSRLSFFDLGAKRLGRLLVVIHHLVVDGVSWQILVENFQTAYQQISQSQTIQLPVKTTFFKNGENYKNMLTFQLCTHTISL